MKYKLNLRDCEIFGRGNPSSFRTIRVDDVQLQFNKFVEDVLKEIEIYNNSGFTDREIIHKRICLEHYNKIQEMILKHAKGELKNVQQTNLKAGN